MTRNMKLGHHRVTILATVLLLLVCVSTDAFRVAVAPTMSMRGLKTNSPLSRLQNPRTPLKYRDRDEETESFVTNVHVAKTTPETSGSQDQAPTASTNAHIPTIRSIAFSQALVLGSATATAAIALAASGHPIDLASIHWNGSNEFFSFWDFSMTHTRVLEGVLAAFPLIYLGTRVENSDRRDASHVNFSTMNMVMTLFGRRERGCQDSKDEEVSSLKPPGTPMLQALALSAALALITGMSEEIVFRGLIPSTIFNLSNSVLIALFGQAVLFGFGHLSRQATVGENRVICGLQALNGLWHGTVYLIAGGDLLPCIIAHALYDIHVFIRTWMNINDQMDYTESAVLQKLSPEEEVEIRRIKSEAGPSLTTETLAFARRFFYAFDYEHRNSLSLSDVKRAVSYAFLHDKAQPSEARVCELFGRMLEQRIKGDGQVLKKELQDRLRLPEFLRLIFLLKAKA